MGLYLQVVLSINEGRSCLFLSQTHAAGSCITLCVDLHSQFNWLTARVRRRHQTEATVQIQAVVAQKSVVATPCALPYVSFKKRSSFLSEKLQQTHCLQQARFSQREALLFILHAALGFAELGASTDHRFSVSSPS